MATIPDLGSICQRAAEATATAPEGYMPKGPVVGRSPAKDNCQTFFRKVSRELERQGYGGWQLEIDGWDNLAQSKHKRNAVADDIADGIGSSPFWLPISSSQAQALANGGTVVVGVSNAGPSETNGHIAFVQPMPSGANQTAHKGSGPLVRDGNEHPNPSDGSFACSSWGATRASRGWKRQTVVKWFVWKDSVPPAAWGMLLGNGKNLVA